MNAPTLEKDIALCRADISGCHRPRPCISCDTLERILAALIEACTALEHYSKMELQMSYEMEGKRFAFWKDTACNTLEKIGWKNG